MKSYTLAETKLTLANVTPKRLAGYCEKLGIKSFSDLKKPDASIDIGLRSMDVSMNVDSLKGLMQICVNEDIGDLDLGDVDLNLTMEVINDFFSQCFPNLTAQLDA